MQANRIVPELLVEDVPKTVRFYCDLLGFKLEMAFPETNPVFAQVTKDNIQIKFFVRSEFQKEIPQFENGRMGGSMLLYIESEKIRDFYPQIEKHVSVVTPLHKTDYGTWEFTFEDCNGYLICFSEKDEAI